MLNFQNTYVHDINYNTPPIPCLKDIDTIKQCLLNLFFFFCLLNLKPLIIYCSSLVNYMSKGHVLFYLIHFSSICHYLTQCKFTELP